MSPQYIGSPGVVTWTFQWRKDGVDLPGQTTGNLVIDPVTLNDAGSYSVFAANAVGSSIGTTSLTVRPPAAPVITTQPASAVATAGQLALNFSYVATGSYPRTHQWRKDGAALAAGTDATLALTNLTLADAGVYTVVITNSLGSATSAPAALTVNSAIPPNISPASPADATLTQGQPATLSVNESGGSPPFAYQWFKAGAAIVGATSFQLNFPAIALSDAGRYSVRITNAAGSATSREATITVNPATPVTVERSPANATLVEGQDVSLSVFVTGSPPIALQWHRDGIAIPGATNFSFSISAASVADAGAYTVVASNAAGSATSGAAIVTVAPAPPPPVIGLRNTSVDSSRSVSLSFFLSPAASAGMSFQWYRNGLPILGETRSSLTVTAANAAGGADYFVVVTNSSGSTASRTAQVAVAANTATPAGGWIAAERAGDMAYFLFANPARIERFNLATDAWATPLALPRTPTAFAIAGNLIYVAFGTALSRFSLEGAGEAAVAGNFNTPVRGLLPWNGFLIAAETGVVTAIRLSDGAKTGSIGSSYDWSGEMAVASQSGRLFSHNNGVSPADVTRTTILPNGTLTVITDSPYHGDYPVGRRLTVFPDEALLADDSGMVYRTDNLVLAGNLGSQFDDMAFTASGEPLVLRSGAIFSYNSRLQQIASMPAMASAARMFVRSGEVTVFAQPASGGAIPKTRLPLSGLQPPQAFPAVNPAGLGYTPDSVLMDRDGVLLLHSKVHGRIFRWSTTLRRYLASLPLGGWPNFVAYSPVTHRIYCGYADNRITQLRLDAVNPAEEPFASAPRRMVGLATAGEYVFYGEEAGSSWVSFVIHGPDGQKIAQRDLRYESAEYAWAPATRRLYYFRSANSPQDLLYTGIELNGSMGNSVENYQPSLPISTIVIRPSPNGATVLLGSGKFFDGTTLVQNNSLPHAIDEAVWLGTTPFTARATTAGIEVQRWGGNNYGLDRTVVLQGRLMRLFEVPGGQIVAIVVRNGLTYFVTLDRELGVVSTDFGGFPNRLANLSSRAIAGLADRLLIPGFVISGTEPKTILIRAAGPALAGFGVAGTVVDPSLTVFNGNGNSVATNDNWSSATNASAIGAVAARVGAFDFAAGSRDAAALLTLNPGPYTVQVRGGAGETSGVALVEVYDAQDNLGSGRLLNIATRAFVGTGGDLLITGIVVQGDAPKTVLVRAVGPGLTPFGVGGVLANPRLRIFRGNDPIGENNGWDEGGTAAAGRISAAATKAGAFALAPGSRDSAVLLTLTAGAYSAQVSGADGGTGVALVEVYEIPD